MDSEEPTKRFTSRVKDYVKYRPSYPTAVIDCLRVAGGFNETAVIADIGSGTGLLTRLFLEQGNRVFGVEPNEAMRAAGEEFLARYDNFTSVAGTAEQTTLPQSSIDFIVAGQAAHWFEPAATRREFERILRQPGTLALVWNTRDDQGSEFMGAYAHVLQRYAREGSGRTPAANDQEAHLRLILGDEIKEYRIPNAQSFDLNGLKGRTLSSSVMPLPGHENFEALLAALGGVFAQYQVEGQVVVRYITELFFANIT